MAQKSRTDKRNNSLIDFAKNQRLMIKFEVSGKREDMTINVTFSSHLYSL